MKVARIGIDKKFLAGILLLAGVITQAMGQAAPVITSFDSNGELVWTNESGFHLFAIEWAPNLTQQWHRGIASLGNVLSQTTTNRAAVPMFYRVRQYGPAFSIPDGGTNMQIDGSFSDWSNMPPVLVNGGSNDLYSVPGDAIDKVYIAKTTNFMFFAVTMTDGQPLSAFDTGVIAFQFEIPNFQSYWHAFVVFTGVGKFEGNWFVHTAVHLVNHLSPNGPPIPTVLATYGSGYWAVGDNFVEWKVPIGDCMDYTGKIVRVWSHYNNNEPTPSCSAYGPLLK